MDVKEQLASLLTKKEFEALKRNDMYLRLKADFPERAKGLSRARKGELVAAYDAGVNELASAYHDHKAKPHPSGIECNNPNRGEPCPECEDKATIETTPVETSEPTEEAPAEATVKLPVREHMGLRFVVYEGDPNRELTRKEAQLLERCAKLIPRLGPKLQTAEFGAPGRRIIDPHKKDRQEVKRTLRQLRWSRIHVLPPAKEEDNKPEAPAPRVLTENM